MALKGLQENRVLGASANVSAAPRTIGGHFSNPGYSGIFEEGMRGLNEVTNGALTEPRYLSPEEFGAAQGYLQRNSEETKRSLDFYGNIAPTVSGNDLKVLEAFNEMRSTHSDNLAAQFGSQMDYFQNLEANRGIEGAVLHQYGETNRTVNARLEQLQNAIAEANVRV